jgi:hypothetical protein
VRVRVCMYAVTCLKMLLSAWLHIVCVHVRAGASQSDSVPAYQIGLSAVRSGDVPDPSSPRSGDFRYRLPFALLVRRWGWGCLCPSTCALVRAFAAPMLTVPSSVRRNACTPPPPPQRARLRAIAYFFVSLS